jgi:hypothetical protein
MNDRRTGKWDSHVRGRPTLILALIIYGISGCCWTPEQSVNLQPDYTFVFLGDLHFDRPEDHNMEWVKKTHPNDIAQIQNYCRVTEENTPALFSSISELNGRQLQPFFSIVQAGDFTEGLCGSYELQSLQFEQAKTCVTEYFGTIPFLMTKGNHDITGPGADKAYLDHILPWLSSQLNKSITQTSYTVRHGEDLFIFFDAYRPDIDWLEDMFNHSNARYTFFITHMPVVPFNARSNWHLFAKDDQQPERQRLLGLLGRHRAIVLCGHLHDYSLLRRNTPQGSFMQLCMNSVIRDKDMPPENYLAGKDKYTADLVNLEPSFSPDTLETRKRNLEKEMADIDFFEYAKTAGSSVIKRYPDKIVIDVYCGCSKIPWKTNTLTRKQLNTSSTLPQADLDG